MYIVLKQIQKLALLSIKSELGGAESFGPTLETEEVREAMKGGLNQTEKDKLLATLNEIKNWGIDMGDWGGKSAEIQADLADYIAGLDKAQQSTEDLKETMKTGLTEILQSGLIVSSEGSFKKLLSAVGFSNLVLPQNYKKWDKIKVTYVEWIPKTSEIPLVNDAGNKVYSYFDRVKDKIIETDVPALYEHTENVNGKDVITITHREEENGKKGVSINMTLLTGQVSTPTEGTVVLDLIEAWTLDTMEKAQIDEMIKWTLNVEKIQKIYKLVDASRKPELKTYLEWKILKFENLTSAQNFVKLDLSSNTNLAEALLSSDYPIMESIRLENSVGWSILTLTWRVEITDAVWDILRDEHWRLQDDIKSKEKDLSKIMGWLKPNQKEAAKNYGKKMNLEAKKSNLVWQIWSNSDLITLNGTKIKKLEELIWNISQNPAMASEVSNLESRITALKSSSEQLAEKNAEIRAESVALNTKISWIDTSLTPESYKTAFNNLKDAKDNLFNDKEKAQKELSASEEAIKDAENAMSKVPWVETLIEIAKKLEALTREKDFVSDEITRLEGVNSQKTEDVKKLEELRRTKSTLEQNIFAVAQDGVDSIGDSQSQIDASQDSNIKGLDAGKLFRGLRWKLIGKTKVINKYPSLRYKETNINWEVESADATDAADAAIAAMDSGKDDKETNAELASTGFINADWKIRQLSKSDNWPKMQTLQQMLIEKKLLPEEYTNIKGKKVSSADGYYGPDTQTAIEKHNKEDVQVLTPSQGEALSVADARENRTFLEDIRLDDVVYGTKSEKVKRIQQTLKSLNYDPWEIDGISWPDTVGELNKWLLANNREQIVVPQKTRAVKKPLKGKKQMSDEDFNKMATEALNRL